MVAYNLSESLNYLHKTAPLFFKKTTQKIYIQTKTVSSSEYNDPYTVKAPCEESKILTFFIIRGSIMGDFVIKLDPPFSGEEKPIHETILQHEILTERFSRFDADPHGMLWLNLWSNFMGYAVNLKERGFLKVLANLHSQKQPLWWKVSNLYNIINGLEMSDNLNVKLLERNFLTYTQPLLFESGIYKSLWVETYDNKCTLCNINFDVLETVEHVFHNVTYLLCTECANNSINENNIIMHGLASSKNVECRIFAAANPYSTVDVLKSLAFDDDVRVRETVLSNVNATESIEAAVKIQN